MTFLKKYWYELAMNTQIVAMIIQGVGNLTTEMLKFNTQQKYLELSAQAALATLPSSPPVTIPEPARTVEVRSPQVIEQKGESPQASKETKAEPHEEPVTKIATGCVPCAIGHLGTCSGLLNESMRFARTDGLTSPEVLTRVNQCMDELNAMERVDLRPEKIAQLPAWHKDLANVALEASRKIRHGLEGLTNVDELEKLAGGTQAVRNAIGNTFLKRRIEQLPKAEQEKVKAVLAKKAEEIAAQEQPA